MQKEKAREVSLEKDLKGLLKKATMKDSAKSRLINKLIMPRVRQKPSRMTSNIFAQTLYNPYRPPLNTYTAPVTQCVSPHTGKKIQL